MYHDDGDKFWIDGQNRILHRGNVPPQLWNKLPVELKIHMLDFTQDILRPSFRREKCIYCEEIIWPFEKRGPILNAPTHNECAFRMMGGSVGHQQGICSCHGFKDHSEIGLTKREGARRALDYFRRTNA